MSHFRLTRTLGTSLEAFLKSTALESLRGPGKETTPGEPATGTTRKMEGEGGGSEEEGGGREGRKRGGGKGGS